MGDDRPTRYTEERDGEEMVVYRASGLGGCLRALVAFGQPKSYVPAITPEWMQKVYDQGTAFEDSIRNAYKAQEEADVQQDQLECELELGEMFGRLVIVRGHIDGLAYHAGWAGGDEPPTLFEAKKFRDSTWPNFLRQGIEVNVNYPWQASVYMHALDLDECHFTGGHVIKIDEDDRANYEPSALITDENGDTWFLKEIAVKRIPSPPFSLKAIRNRIMEVEKLIHAGFDAKEVECNRSQYPCPFFKLHDWDDNEWEWSDPEQQKLADAWMTSLDAVGRQAKELKEQLDAVEAKKREIVNGFREFLAETGDAAEVAKKLVGSEFTVSHVRKHIPEHTRKAQDQDYFTIKPNKKGD